MRSTSCKTPRSLSAGALSALYVRDLPVIQVPDRGDGVEFDEHPAFGEDPEAPAGE